MAHNDIAPMLTLGLVRKTAVFIPDFSADRALDRRTTRAGKMVKDRRFEHFADQIALGSLPALG